MPIYEYRCRECGHELEALQKLSDDPLTACPACEQPALQKKVSAAGFRLKGGGWYETDFKQGNKRNVAGDSEPAKAAKSESPKKDAGTDSKSKADSKPAKADKPASGGGSSAAA